MISYSGLHWTEGVPDCGALSAKMGQTLGEVEPVVPLAPSAAWEREPGMEGGWQLRGPRAAWVGCVSYSFWGSAA